MKFSHLLVCVIAASFVVGCADAATKTAQPSANATTAKPAGTTADGTLNSEAGAKAGGTTQPVVE